jgi:DNA-binding IclR family transcriptional regulator
MNNLRLIMQQAGVHMSARRGIIRAIQEAGLVQYHQDRQQFTLESAARTLLNEDERGSRVRRAVPQEEEDHDSAI